MSTIAPKRRAARCLFGAPNEKLVNDQLNHELRSIYERDSQKWSFDFEVGVPLENGSGDYQFEAIRADKVPSFYHEKRVKAGKTRRAITPESEVDSETMYSILSPRKDKKHSPIATTSSCVEEKGDEEYEKPITRAAARLNDNNEKKNIRAEKEFKQTKLTNYMPVRKRRSETCLVSLSRSTSTDQLTIVVNNKAPKRNNTVLANNVGAPRRPVKFVPSEITVDTKLSSASDTTLVTSPRSPPPKRLTRRRRQTAAGDF